MSKHWKVAVCFLIINSLQSTEHWLQAAYTAAFITAALTKAKSEKKTTKSGNAHCTA